MFTNDSTETQLDYREIRVTPSMAKKWLELNTSNRNKKPGRVAAFAVDMQDGEWMLNGEALKFSGTYEEPKKLLDGQNRLMAVVQAGVPVVMSVFFQVPEWAQEAMDSGTRRTVADNVKIQGKNHAVIVSSGASIAMRVSEGNLNGGQIKATNVAMQRFIKDHPELEEAAEVASRYAKRSGIAPSFICYSYWCMAKIDREAALDFWAAAAEKVGLMAGDPVLVLTNTFQTYKSEDKKMYLGTALSMIFRAWNYRRQGKPLTTMKASHKGKPIGIPELI